MQLVRTTAFHCLGQGTAGAGACIMTSLSSPAYAQTTLAAASASDIPMTEVVVTGSMLRRTDTKTESPVTTLTAEDIQKSGLTTIADVVRTVSADNSGTIPTAFGAGFAAGASGVALRGLTVNSTLVVIDGRRAAPYAVADDGQRSFVDLNTIPLDSVERVEVLKDGASSIYGADAIAGVVNVILKKEYPGGQSSMPMQAKASIQAVAPNASQRASAHNPGRCLPHSRIGGLCRVGKHCNLLRVSARPHPH